MKTLIIANPTAGGGRGKSLWPRLERHLQTLEPYDLCWSAARGDAQKIAATKKYRLVVAYGGDGTIHEVANGLLQIPKQERPCLGLLSVGTGSDLIGSLGIGKNLSRQIQVLQSGREVDIDVGEIEYATAGGRERRFFLNIADAGLGGEVLKRLARSRHLFGRRLAYLSASLQSYLFWKPVSMEITIDGEKIRDSILIAAVANGRSFGGGMQIAPEADLRDGLFDIVLVKNIKGVWFPLAITLLYLKRTASLPQVRILRGREVNLLASQPVSLDIDGESIGFLPARFKIVPRALRVKAP